jgi:hypothetical protein
MKRIIVLLLFLTLICGGAFAGPLAPWGWGLALGGATGACIQYIGGYSENALYFWIASGVGGGLVLLDLLFSSSGSSSTAQAKPNEILKHVSLGAAPGTGYIGLRFEF